VETASKEKAAARSAHTPWLIAGAILLTTAGSLEWLMASAHGVSVTSIHKHTNVPGVVHILAALSIPASLFPLLRRRSVLRPWSLVAAAIIATLLLIGLTLAAGLLAWLISATIMILRRRSPKPRREFTEDSR